MSEFVLEILCEEIPARMQHHDGIKKTFIEAMTAHDSYSEQGVELYISPTRLLFITECECAEPIPAIVQTFISQMRWPKSMRWNSTPITWARPIRNICCMFAGETVTGEVGGIPFTNISFGHKILSPQPFLVESGKIVEQLRERYVIVNAQERHQIILDEINRIERELEVMVDKDEALMQEVVGLVDYPVVLVGKIQRQYSELPTFVVISPMKKQQRYFPTYNGSTLSRYFVVVANTNRNATQVIRGNERVLNARLDDAKFYFSQTGKLSDYIEALKTISVHDSIGSMYDKACRMSVIAKSIAPTMAEDVERMCMLAKCDLATGIVAEFPELQGLMGSHYARLDGEKEEIAQALSEQYLYDSLPQTQFGSILAISDKIEQLVSFFASDLRPTGSKDPFALRRSALFVLKTIRQNKISVDLDVLLKIAGATIANYTEQLHGDLLKFFRDRMLSLLKNEHNSKLVEAVLVNHNILDMFNRIECVGEYDLSNILSSYRRAYKMVQKEATSTALEVGKLQTTYEQDLAGMLSHTPPCSDTRGYLEYLESLSVAVSSMMDNVKVSEDRDNRLALLKAVIAQYDRFVAFDHLL